ncbi:alpha-amylase family glycosyl hydrolase [Exiguobacterium sp. SL14]|nr:alpha-amylase family glycosyl hydrolase [Exiguobacterium sp. SL14]
MKLNHRHQVVYHLYPKSFLDTNEDGIGDLDGIRKRLDYLHWLGVDMIWLCPVYSSPGYDHGYDVADYTSIDPVYGSMDEMEALINEANHHGITVMMDIVANHTSHCHEWFIASENDPNGPHGDTYIWRDEPTEVESFFGGSAWTYSSVRQQYYFHSFAKEQPDLNWEQSIVAKEFARILSFWTEKGIRGFRFDVIDLIGKQFHPHRWLDFERIQKGLREMMVSIDRSRLLLVGEAGGLSPSEIRQLQKEGLLDVVFNFETCALDEEVGKGKWHLRSFDPRALKRTIRKWQEEMKEEGWNSLFWNNHDQPRVITRWYDNDLNAKKCLPYSS